MEGLPDTRGVVCLDMVLVHRWWARRTICWGTVLGWKELDRLDGVRIMRLEIGALVGVGLVLAAMTLVSHTLSIR